MEVRHFIETDDFTKEEYLEMLKVIRTLKDAERKGIRLPLLKDQSLAMMFDQPSTRTRVSFEAAMTQPVSYTHLDVYKRQSLHRTGTA